MPEYPIYKVGPSGHIGEPPEIVERPERHQGSSQTDRRQRYRGLARNACRRLSRAGIFQDREEGLDGLRRDLPQAFCRHQRAFLAAASKCSSNFRCLPVGIFAVEKYLLASYGKLSRRSILNPGFPGARGRRSIWSGSN